MELNKTDQNVANNPLPHHDNKAHMISCYDEQDIVRTQDEDVEVPQPAEDFTASKLQNAVKFKWFYDQLGFSSNAHLATTKGILTVAKQFNEQCLAAKGSITRTIKEANTTITFTDADRWVPYGHNRPLYVTATVNDTEFKWMLMDGGASINIMPLSTFVRLG